MNPNYYINWVLYAIYGDLRAADGIMRAHRRQVYEVAEALRNDYGESTTVTLYRGILTQPGMVKRGKLAPEPRVTFVSFSEDIKVACWFADPTAIISEVAVANGYTQGWVASYSPGPGETLFSHRWREITGDLVRAAQGHPEIDAKQFAWNIKTQSEVILKPIREPLDVEPIDVVHCPSTRSLDARLAPPWLQ